MQRERFMATTNAWGPRTGMFVPQPVVAGEYRFMGQQNSVKNEGACLPADLRQLLSIVDEEPTHTNVAFFRKSNREAVHNLIISEVARLSRGAYKIGRQSENEVTALMIHVYTNSSHSQGGTAVDRVRKLNAFVAKAAADNIIQNVTQNLYYMRDLTTHAPTGPALPAPSNQRDSVLGNSLR